MGKRMQIYVSVEDQGGKEFGYTSDVAPRVGELITFGWEERLHRVTEVSHRLRKRTHVVPEEIVQEVVDVQVVEI